MSSGASGTDSPRPTHRATHAACCTRGSLRPPGLPGARPVGHIRTPPVPPGRTAPPTGGRSAFSQAGA
ncbi:hypothetical protein GCM10009605_33260 [Nocardiopsis composta]